MEQKYLTVGAITKYLKFKFDSDEHLRNVYIKGEISNFKAHSTGHFYFSIKDEVSKINALMFANNAKKVDFKPQEGSKVLLKGRISVYESTGNYQIYVDEMIEDGVGNLYIAFEKLKKQLDQEGLFDSSRKQKLKKIPSKVGIVTAPTGAAVKDIISTIKRRFPICEIYLFPSLVQGELAKEDIVKNIKLANNYDLDVLIVGRGGGSIEDLWAFNEEIVARAIFESRIPIISAVGHEVDFTIADFVADLRAPTPTGAAEMAVPNLLDLQNNLNQFKIRINENINKKINFNKLILDSHKNSFVIKNPLIMYENKKQKLDLIIESINKNIYLNIEKKYDKLNNLKNSYILLQPVNLYKSKLDKLNNIKNNYILKEPINLYKNKIISLEHILEKLNLINPLEVLRRGYSLTYLNDSIIKSTKDVKVDQTINLKLTDGIIDAVVVNIKENKND